MGGGGGDPYHGGGGGGGGNTGHGTIYTFNRNGHPTFNRNPFNGNINPYYWVDDHPLLYGNNWSLDPGTYIPILYILITAPHWHHKCWLNLLYVRTVP